MAITTNLLICIAKVWWIMAQTTNFRNALILLSRVHQVTADNVVVTTNRAINKVTMKNTNLVQMKKLNSNMQTMSWKFR